MRVLHKYFTMAAADPDAVCLSQKPAAAGFLTLNGVLSFSQMNTTVLPSVVRSVAVLDAYRPLAIASSGNDSGLTITVTGTNQTGSEFTETLSGPNAGTVQTLNPFQRIHSIHVDGAAAGNLTVGTSDEAYTPIIRVPIGEHAFDLTVQIQLSPAASLKWQWQYSLSDPEAETTDAEKMWTAFGNNLAASAVVALTATAQTMIRGYITDYVSGNVNYSVARAA